MQPAQNQTSLETAYNLHRQGQLAQAEAAYRDILQKQPDHAQALHGLGAVLLQQNRGVEALKILSRAAAQDKSNADVLSNLGVAYRMNGDESAALEIFQRALRFSPNHPAVNMELAALLDKQGRATEAIPYLQQIFAQTPQNLRVAARLSTLLLEARRLQECDDVLMRADKATPDHPGILNNIALLRQAQHRAEEAVAAFKRVLELQPDYAEAWNNLGIVQQGCGRFDEAMQAFNRAVELKPDYDEARFNRVYCYLAFGRLPEAWDEWRHRANYNPSRQYDLPLWDGGDPAGKTIFMWCQQGIGDYLLIASMIPDLLARGAKLVIEVQKRLLPLYERSFPGVTLFEKVVLDEEGRRVLTPPDPRMFAPEITAQCPNLWPTIFLRPTMESFPRHGGYLKADPAKTAQMRAKYEAMGKKRIIGLSWASKARDTGHYKNSQLREWLPILQTPDVLFIDLQYGDTSAERAGLAREHPDIALYHDPDFDQLNDLDSFAAQVAACDEVISISNTAAHFAGALGKKGRVLLPEGIGTLWYWFRDRADSPFYPSLKLYRQSQQGSWQDVIARVAADLKEDT